MEPPSSSEPAASSLTDLASQYPMPPKAVIAAGGVEVEVERLVSTSNEAAPIEENVRELVKVRIAAYDRMLTYLQFMQNEHLCAQIYTGKDDAWVRSLTPESHERVITEGQRLWLPFFLRWYPRYMERNRVLMPIDKVLAAAAKATASALNNSSPSSVSEAGAAAKS